MTTEIIKNRYKHDDVCGKRESCIHGAECERYPDVWYGCFEDKPLRKPKLTEEEALKLVEEMKK